MHVTCVPDDNLGGDSEWDTEAKVGASLTWDSSKVFKYSRKLGAALEDAENKANQSTYIVFYVKKAGEVDEEDKKKGNLGKQAMLQILTLVPGEKKDLPVALGDIMIPFAPKAVKAAPTPASVPAAEEASEGVAEAETVETTEEAAEEAAAAVEETKEATVAAEATEEATEEAAGEPAEAVEATEAATEAPKEAAEEAAEEPTKEPTEETAEEPTKEPTEETVEEAAEEPIKEPTEEAEEPTKEPTEEAEVATEAAEEATEEATKEAVEEATGAAEAAEDVEEVEEVSVPIEEVEEEEVEEVGGEPVVSALKMSLSVQLRVADEHRDLWATLKKRDATAHAIKEWTQQLEGVTRQKLMLQQAKAKLEAAGMGGAGGPGGPGGKAPPSGSPLNALRNPEVKKEPGLLEKYVTSKPWWPGQWDPKNYALTKVNICFCAHNILMLN